MLLRRTNECCPTCISMRGNAAPKSVYRNQRADTFDVEQRYEKVLENRDYERRRQPTISPIMQPTLAPTISPIMQPTFAPTNAPMQPTFAPTNAPMQPTTVPTNAPMQPKTVPIRTRSNGTKIINTE